MIRPTRTRVRHGMASCARYGCRRPECLRAYNRARKQLKLNKARGVTATVDAEKTAAWARHLALHGMSAKDIANRAGVHDKTITGLLAGRSERIYRDTADAILGIPTPSAGHQPDTEGLVDATGARRRIRALTAIGFTLPVMAAALGVAGETIGAIRQNRRRYVRVSLNLAITDMYEQLQHQDPVAHGATHSGAVRAKGWARNQGWPDPTWWEDYGGLDNPNAPETEGKETQPPRFRVLADEGLWLEAQGYTRQQAADRLGVTKANLQASISRARRAEEVAA